MCLRKNEWNWLEAIERRSRAQLRRALSTIRK
jgi:hypothetical protein